MNGSLVSVKVKDRIWTNPDPRVAFSDDLTRNITSEQHGVPGGVTTLLGIKAKASGRFEWVIDLDAAKVPSSFRIANVSKF